MGGVNEGYRRTGRRGTDSNGESISTKRYATRLLTHLPQLPGVKGLRCILSQTLGEHSPGDLYKASDVGAVGVVAGSAVLLCGLPALLVDLLHDLL